VGDEPTIIRPLPANAQQGIPLPRTTPTLPLMAPQTGSGILGSKKKVFFLAAILLFGMASYYISYITSSPTFLIVILLHEASPSLWRS
jgi:hypothetical protein